MADKISRQVSGTALQPIGVKPSQTQSESGEFRLDERLNDDKTLKAEADTRQGMNDEIHSSKETHALETLLASQRDKNSIYQSKENPDLKKQLIEADTAKRCKTGTVLNIDQIDNLLDKDGGEVVIT